MSRLDSFIRRLEAQRACLDASPALIAGIPGPILELGLGNGRTYDHLRGLYPDRAIFVFERQPAAHPDCIPDPAHLIVGDIHATLPTASARLPGRAALVHNDLGTGDATRNAELARWLAAALPPLIQARRHCPLRSAARAPAAAARGTAALASRGSLLPIPSHPVRQLGGMNLIEDRAGSGQVGWSGCGCHEPSSRLFSAVLGRARHGPLPGAEHAALRRQHRLRRDALRGAAADLRCRHRAAPARPRDGLERPADPLAPVLHPHPHGSCASGCRSFGQPTTSAIALEFWSGHLTSQGRRLEEVLDQLMQPPFFPVPLDIMHACIAFHDFVARRCDRDRRWRRRSHGGAQSSWRRRRLPGRVRGRVACYVTDTEHVPGEPDAAVLGLIAGRGLRDLRRDLHRRGVRAASRAGATRPGRRACACARRRARGSWWPSTTTPDHDDEALDGSRPRWSAAARLAGRPGRSGDHALIAGPSVAGGACGWACGRCSGGRPGGFFIPYRHADIGGGWRLSGARATVRREPARHVALAGADRDHSPTVCAGWTARRRCRAGARTGSRASTAPRSTRSSDSGRPRRILEVGSGHSTRFLAQAVADGGLDCAITCIDPQPRADLAPAAGDAAPPTIRGRGREPSPPNSRPATSC